ncbi:type II toxin-antitoxin system VapC family toxin [Rhizobium lusitanum]|uniref:Ribonuclease VapC n=1 Tax=Rhizobium lusitanum TaxID=293958 RepID=A0A7X0IRK5_9HYPH|nr:type II toxin-antitoxin system VapC family toxin [Rhizobium lusitanum]MBB6485428.1 ribonuclease VapC [Rhizobium lusitanum]
MFIDASVLSAMMTNEEDARGFANRMQLATARMTSPAEAMHAAIEISATLALSPAEAGEAVRTFLQLMNIQLLAVPPRAAFIAAETYERYGQGDHPARLSLDDCMTYACARYYRQPLLSKSGRFDQTDIELA